MTFYLKPVEGTITTNLFQSYATCRLHYLSSLRNYDTSNYKLPSSLVQYADCLIEGSAKDRVSHFALRGVSVLHPPLHSYVLQKEQLLFNRRLLKMQYQELKQSVMILLKQVKEYETFEDDHRDFFNRTATVLHEILRKRFLNHVEILINDNDGKKICPIHLNTTIVGVPFHHVIKQVANRDVQLSSGQAHLRCDQIPTYLTQLFTKLLEYSSDKIRHTGCFTKLGNDSRFLELLSTLKKLYLGFVPLDTVSIQLKQSSLSLEDLDRISSYFPPCMRAIHYTLKSRHRLCHRPRVQYTLYLKEIGLSVEDCLKLLQSEYSKQAVQTGHNQKHKCEHSWNQDSRRYTYGTRHLYGLEGGKKNYSSHSCRTIQSETPGPNECGGCPFLHFDKENLQTFLEYDLQGKENADAFLLNTRRDKTMPIESCHLHLRFKSKTLMMGNTDTSQNLRNLENSQVKLHNVFKPKHYFAVMSKIST